MEIEKNISDNKLEIRITGRIDTVTAPELDNEINSAYGTEKLVLDFEKVEYISSAGLRILLSNQKKFSGLNGMVIKNVNEDVMEIFDMTGFSDILNIE